MPNHFRLNHAGVAALLKSGEFQAMTRAAAESVAANVEQVLVEGIPGDIEIPVTVSETVTDRAHCSVALAHPSGLAVQAKHGALTKAAAAAGLEVHGG